MNCTKCNLSYDQNANFCQNCGRDLSEFELFAKSSKSSSPNNDDKLLLFILGFDLLMSIIWFVFNKLVSFLALEIQTVYPLFTYVTTFLSFSVFIAVTIKVKNEKNRTLLIVFLIVKFFLAIAYLSSIYMSNIF